jgi:hypothetical protein
MQTSNPAAASLAELVQLCVEYAAMLPAATQKAVIEYAQKHTRIVNAAIKDEPDASNHDQ